MGLARQFNQRLHSEIKSYAAWLPVANGFALGDYGLISGGVFQRMGNIREFGVDPGPGQPTPPVTLDFKSEGVTVVSLVAGEEVEALPDVSVDASLKITFNNSDSFLVKAAGTSVSAIPNVREIATQLAHADGWRRRYRVVSSTVVGQESLVVASRAANASFELSGKANLLKQVGVGAIDASITVSSESNVGLSIVGKTGVIGLGLFKLKLWGDNARLLGPDDEADAEIDKQPELEDDV